MSPYSSLTIPAKSSVEERNLEGANDTIRLAEINKALRVSEARYRRLFETAQDGILLLNAESAQIEDVNPFLIEILGYSHDEFLGKKFGRSEHSRILHSARMLSLNCKQRDISDSTIFPWRLKTGAEFQLSLSAMFILVKALMSFNVTYGTIRNDTLQKLH